MGDDEVFLKPCFLERIQCQITSVGSLVMAHGVRKSEAIQAAIAAVNCFGTPTGVPRNDGVNIAV
jgi:hypothetical protein